jgi:hemolysin III
MQAVLTQQVRPMLRGYIHLAAAVLSPFALAWLVVSADSARGYVGASLFGAALVLLFSTSALYHVPPWPPRVKAILRRVDHSMIFVAIVGLYAPFCLQAMPLAWGITILSVAGGLALAGILLKAAWMSPPAWLNLLCYLAIGWVAIVAAPVVDLGGVAIAAVVLSGLLFTVGGVCFASKRPRLAPRVFGHHEVFHVCVTAGAGVLYAVVHTSVL